MILHYVIPTIAVLALLAQPAPPSASSRGRLAVAVAAGIGESSGANSLALEGSIGHRWGELALGLDYHHLTPNDRRAHLGGDGFPEGRYSTAALLSYRVSWMRAEFEGGGGPVVTLLNAPWRTGSERPLLSLRLFAQVAIEVVEQWDVIARLQGTVVEDIALVGPRSFATATLGVRFRAF